MIKFIKIMCINFCFGIRVLQSTEYNVITVSRDTTTASYNRLSMEEIYLVFAQLARCFPQTNASTLAPDGGWSSQSNSILQQSAFKIIKPGVPTIIVFNEAFFGQDEPLSKKEVNRIIEIYKNFQTSNTYLYINFLYTDSDKAEYASQVDVSKTCYAEILRNEGEKILAEVMQPSLIFGDRVLDCIDEGRTGEKVYIEKERTYLETAEAKIMGQGQLLLFNQTKIFYEGNEIGYYNKSSFCNEVSDFLNKNLYYVIGNFRTQYLEGKARPPIACLTCYDIDVITEGQMPRENICVFASNTSASLPLTLNNFNESGTILSNFYICADPKSESEGKNISGILPNIKNSLEYLTKEEAPKEKNIFYFKTFFLTDNSIIETVR